MTGDSLLDRGAEAFAVDRKRAARRHPHGIGAAEDERAQPAHLGVQEAHGVAFRVVGTEGIGTDQFGQPGRRVRRRHPRRPHLVQHYLLPAPRQLPSRFAAGETAADHMHCLGCVAHFGEVLATAIDCKSASQISAKE